jgi:ubiquinone/menaquinone biosynthesis C-methylase UbiE
LIDEQARKVIEYYREEAPDYDALYVRPNDHIYDEITWRFTEPYLPKQGVALDAGGGAGGWAVEMAKRGLKVMLYDLSPDMLKEASKKIGRHGLAEFIEVRQGDIRETLINEEALLFAKYLRGEIRNWAPREGRWPMFDVCQRDQRKDSF